MISGTIYHLTDRLTYQKVTSSWHNATEFCFKTSYHSPNKTYKEKTMSELTHAVTDATFDLDVANADVPVLLDFWAPWCGPCKMIAPILEDVAAEFEGSIKVCKINVDENSETAARYGVRGIPTLMLFNNGEVAGTKVGALAKSDLLAFISDNT